ncbi:MAG TPA: hypothetical protein VJ464_30500 [Blastocatellia bacterium]|nr:hypothetical protein [Blastocatellia bacterium]
MDEETYRKWDVGAKVVAPILTVVGLLIGVWQFSKEQGAQLERQYKLIAENDRLEFKRRLWEKQLEVYMKISNVVGKIAAEDLNKADLKKAIDQFYSLYWGDMLYVEDKAVERAMIDFHVEIQDYLKGNSTRDRLKVRADQLITVCRDSSRNQWFTQPQ